MTNSSLLTSTAAEVGQALEHGNSPVRSMCKRTGGDAFSTEASSLTVATFITSLTFIVFNTEIMGARLHTSMIHWYFRQPFKYICFLTLGCLLPLLLLTPQHSPPLKFHVCLGQPYQTWLGGLDPKLKGWGFSS